MIKKLLLTACCVIVSLGLTQSVSAVELNSTNITQAPFNCATNAISCNLQGRGITSIASGTFTNHSSLTQLILQNNQITSIESGDFSGLSSLTALVLQNNQITSIESGDFQGLSSLTLLVLQNNQITSIESGDFQGLSSLTRLELNSNCFNNEDSSITTYLDGVGVGGIAFYSPQHVCLAVDYSLSTSTAGSVTGSLVLRGPTSKVATIANSNNMSTYNHVFTGNSSFLFNYTSIINTNNFLWKNNVNNPTGNPYPKTITGTVTWIDTIAPVVTLSGSSMLSLNVGTSYTELGATWTDNVDGNGIITSASSGTVSTSVLGSYVLEYTYTDTAGNTGNTVIRTVQVIAPIVAPVSSGGRGGGGGSLTKDTCPQGDYSPSYYDRTCGTKTVITTTGGIVRTTSTGSIVQTTGSTVQNAGSSLPIVKPTVPTAESTLPTVESTLSQEESSSTAVPKAQQQAYEWALSQGITTAPSLEAAKLDTKITRAQLAKMVSVYATTVRDKQPVGDIRECIFEDEHKANADLVAYMRQACQLQIMGVTSDGTPLTNFRPNDDITRAEFGTVLSRILYGQTYNTTGDKRREGHLQKLKTNNIITVIDPTLVELRGWIMVMLYRT